MLLLALSAILTVAPATEHDSPRPDENSLQPRVLAAYARSRRDAHSLIGTFDISNMFKKKPRPKPDADSRPSSSSLRAANPLPVIFPPSPKELTSPPTEAPTSTRQTLVTLTTTTKSQPQYLAVTSTSQLPSLVSKRKKSRKSKNPSKSSKGTRAATSRSDGTREVGNATRRSALVAADGVVWPVKHAAVVEGDIVLGGLMMVSTSRAL